MTMPPSVTVVMPTFNRAAFVGRAIDSLFAQQMTDWELTDQRHKLLQEPAGGVNLYRQRFAVDQPIRFRIFFSDIADLAAQLRETGRMTRLRANAWRHRERFTFDAHADRLIAFFREVIAAK